MPWALDGHVQIDRLVYPTLGNPNLYTKSDPNDQFMTVLRIEDAAYAHLDVQPEAITGSSLSRLPITNDPATGFAFFLVPRAARDNNTESTQPINSGNGTGVFRIYPNEVLVSPIPADMPEVLKQRKTLRFLFKQGAMQRVPAGMYDVRMEVRKDNELYKPVGNAVGVYEYQYNAVRVFDSEPEEYKVINITDTQVSVGDLYGAKTKDRLDELVHFLNTTNDPAVLGSSFITFNGDLHNGGSPASLRQRTVAHTYNDEAKAIVDTLKYLPVPIFLTAGNHDGYVSTGHVPGAVKALDTGLLDSLPEVINDASPKAWPDFAITKFQAYIDQTEKADQLGGIPKDLFTGTFSRTREGHRVLGRLEGSPARRAQLHPLRRLPAVAEDVRAAQLLLEVRQELLRVAQQLRAPAAPPLGLGHVHRELRRRHERRADAIGSIASCSARRSPETTSSSSRTTTRAAATRARTRATTSSSSSTAASTRARSTTWSARSGTPQVCKLPPWALSRDQTESCVHDGLQEWMRPDEELDCAWDERKDGYCDKALFDPNDGLAPLLLQRRRADDARRAEPAGPHDAARAHALQPARGAPERRRAPARPVQDRRRERAAARDPRGPEPDPRLLVRADGDGHGTVTTTRSSSRWPR